MASGLLPTAADSQERRCRSIFDLPAGFFDSCQLLDPSSTNFKSEFATSPAQSAEKAAGSEKKNSNDGIVLPRLTCNTCKAEFESLNDQRSHFKSDIHRLNIKLSIAGKDILREDDFEELTSESFKDYDVSSISGSEDEADSESVACTDGQKALVESIRKKKLFIRLDTGERISIWKCLIMDDSERISFENCKAAHVDNPRCLQETEVIARLKSLIHETKGNKNLRVVLLASGGHFAGSVFDGKSVVAHKTFHRYVVRAKAGKKQSLKDASGKSIHSAGASLRRYNELALKKEIQELLASWKHYFDAASCVFIHAPSSSRQLLFNGMKPYLSSQCCDIRTFPFTVRRPTFKESQRVYNQLTQVTYEAEEVETPGHGEDSVLGSNSDTNTLKEDLGNKVIIKSVLGSNNDTSTLKDDFGNKLKIQEQSESPLSDEKFQAPAFSDENEESEAIGKTTLLHESAKSGNAQKVLELLHQGMDPCVKDERGRTPYMLASDKEVRNTFRRFMAANLDKWDWHAAKVPSALTKEMEESQAAKQAEKDAKRRARAKELKKLRRAREKKAQAEVAQSQNATPSQPSGGSKLSEEEELRRARAAEREKRAAAAERRMADAALNSQGASTLITSSTSNSTTGLYSDVKCSCCNSSLAGKIPFHRYDYKYCSTSCMHVHREFLEDGDR